MKVIIGLLIGVLLSAGITAAQEKPEIEKAVKFIGQLYELPDNSRAVNKAHNERLKERAAEILIQNYALLKKLRWPTSGSVSGYVTPEDVRAALEDFNVATPVFANRTWGRGDNRVVQEDLDKFREEAQRNPGLRTLLKMMAERL